MPYNFIAHLSALLAYLEVLSVNAINELNDGMKVSIPDDFEVFLSSLLASVYKNMKAGVYLKTTPSICLPRLSHSHRQHNSRKH